MIHTLGNVVPFPIERPQFCFNRALLLRLIDKAVGITGISREEIVGKRQYRELAYTRFAIAQVAHERGKSSSQIGRILGYQDHTGILHALKRAPGLEEQDPDFAYLVSMLRAEAAR